MPAVFVVLSPLMFEVEMLHEKKSFVGSFPCAGMSAEIMAVLT